MKRTELVCAAVGLGIALALLALDFFAFQTASRMANNVSLGLWPASLALMAMDRITTWWQVCVLAVLVLHNTLLYGILGFAIAWIVKSVRSILAPGSLPKGPPYSTTRVATCFGAIGFAVASILVLVDALADISRTSICRYLMPLSPFGHAKSESDASSILLLIANLAPVNAALYFLAGLLVGGVWRLLRRAKPA